MRSGLSSRLAWLIAALALSAAGPLTAQARDQVAPTPSGTASIAGRIEAVIAGRSEPVRRARVTLYTPFNGEPPTTDTDTNGRFRFDRLPAGAYRVSVAKAGFVQPVAEGRRSSEAPVPVDLKAGQALMIDLPMLRGAALEGRVVDGNGDPMVGLPVLAIRVLDQPSDDPLADYREVHTDDLGRFRVHTLPAGHYVIEGSGTYYPGVLDKQKAQVLTVAAGQSLDNLDFMFGAEPFTSTADAEPDAPPPATDGARVAGRVMRVNTGTPIAVAVVRLTGLQGQTSQATTRSDARGRFEFTGLPAGPYRLDVTAQGYVSLDVSPIGQSLGKLIDVKERAQLDKIDVSLAPPSAIEGRVLDEFGDPAPGVHVQIAQVVAALGTTILMPTNGGGVAVPTDDRGWYRVYGLTPGDYYALALTGLFHVSAAPTSASDGPPGFAPTFFPGTDRPPDAKAVHVTTGKDAIDVTFALTPARMATVVGAVRDASGQPVANARVMLMRTQGREIRALIPANATSDANGSFTYRNVPPGAYVLQGFGSGGFGSAPINVPDVDDGAPPAAVALTLHALITARGHISFEGGEPLPSKDRVMIGFQPTDFTSGPSGGTRIQSHLTDDWAFDIPQLAWFGVVRVSVPPPWGLKSVMLDGRDIADTPYDFQTADVNGLEIVMTSALGTVRGTAIDGVKAATDYGVIVFPEDRTKWTYPSRFVTAARANQQGAFTATGLLPGRYLAVAVPMVAIPIGGPTATWLATVRPMAEAFAITAGSSATVTLKVIR